MGYSAAGATLAAAFLMAAAMQPGRGSELIPPVIVLGVCAVGLAARTASSGAGAGRQFLGLRKNLLAQLMPVVCLSLAYPVVGAELATLRVGTLPGAVLLLATSLAVPWISQIVCMPLFTALSAEPPTGQSAALASRLLSLWPFVAAASVPVAAGFGVAIGLILGWDNPGVGALTVLCVLHTLFSQSLVVAILERNHLSWAVAWMAYAMALVAAPAWWFLPPVAGLLTQLVYLATQRPGLARLVSTRDIVGQFAKGGLIGAVLWCDKLFFFLKSPQHFDPLMVFLAVLPAVVAYNYYFVRLAPRLDRLVEDMRATMENDPLARSTPRLRELARQVEESTVKVACVGAILAFLAVFTVSLTTPATSLLYASMTIASSSFLVVTVLLYKLDYIGRGDLVCWLASAHLAVVSLVFLAAEPNPTTYLVLAGLSVGVLVVAARSCLGAWRVPEYSLFWRHATQW